MVGADEAIGEDKGKMYPKAPCVSANTQSLYPILLVLPRCKSLIIALAPLASFPDMIRVRGEVRVRRGSSDRNYAYKGVAFVCLLQIVRGSFQPNGPD